MAYERTHRLDDRQLEAAKDESERPAWEWEIPGKQTQAELLDDLSRTSRGHQVAAMCRAAWSRHAAAPGRNRFFALKLELGDFQALALRDVLSRLDPTLRASTLAAAEPTAARRVGGPSGGHATRAGRGMWRAAERRAVTLYRRALAAGTGALETPAVMAALNAIGSGAPLDPHVCRKMERILGVRLDRVRLHTGAVAQEAAAAAHARAFTVGEDVFFPGYDPHSRLG